MQLMPDSILQFQNINKRTNYRENSFVVWTSIVDILSCCFSSNSVPQVFDI
uniref:Uncharacterized protein n=1 Tax=Arundo donax TaxID=35708 RepID=A0A0A9EX95_ARUDO